MRKTRIEQEQGAIKAPFLDRVYSLNKQTEILDILQAIQPTHAERLWLTGFLKYVGYSYDEVISIIDDHCEWADYNPRITAYQVGSIFKQPHHTRRTASTNKPRPRKWQLTPTETYRIQIARSQESHRTLTAWMQKNGIPIYDAAPDLEFDPAKMSMTK